VDGEPSNASSLPEVIGSAGFAIDPDDERNMAGAIIATIMQDSMAAELRQKGPEQAAKFSWETTAQETLQIYDRVLRAA
ncbi:MAG: glycosyltransferase family 1 protein, partial [Chloroflexota bacterium]